MDFFDVNLTGGRLEVFGFADFNQLHVEYQSGIRTDFTTGNCLIAVGKFGRDIECGFAAFFQELNTFSPTWDYLAYREAYWAAVGFAAVKYSTINQTAFVFNGNDVVFSRFFCLRLL